MDNFAKLFTLPDLPDTFQFFSFSIPTARNLGLYLSHSVVHFPWLCQPLGPNGKSRERENKIIRDFPLLDTVAPLIRREVSLPSEPLVTYRLSWVGAWGDGKMEKMSKYFPHPFWAWTDPFLTPEPNTRGLPWALAVHTKVRFRPSHCSTSSLGISQEKYHELFAGLVVLQNSDLHPHFSCYCLLHRVFK